MRHLFLHGILSIASIAVAMAGGAVFSPDGNSVTLLPLTGTANELWRVDLQTKVVGKIPLGLPEGQAAKSLAGGADGELLLLTAEAVYVHSDKGTKKLCDTSGVKDANDLAVVPPKAGSGMADWLIVSGIDKDAPEDSARRTYYARKPGGKSFDPVFCRRIESVGEGAFTPDGRFLFIADGALWDGSFEHLNDSPPDQWQVMLEGTGIAPLAYCDSNFSNTGAYIVGDTTAVAGKFIYVALSGRHGTDVLLRVTMPAESPPCDGTDSVEALAAHYAMQAKVLSSVKVLDQISNIQSLAAVVVKGEERVLCISDNHNGTSQMILWTSKAGKAEVIGEYKTEQ